VGVAFYVRDLLQNLATGLGTYKDKSTANSFVFSPLARDQLDTAYRSDWLARKVIDVIPYDMTRGWRVWQGDEAQVELLEEAEKKFDLRRKTGLALTRSRLYGGAALFIGTGDSDPAQPLNVEVVGKDGLKYVHVLSRHDLVAGQLDYDPMSETYGCPIYYDLTNQDKGLVRIHPSRLVRFIGSALPDPRMQAADGWGDSLLFSIWDAVKNTAIAAQATAHLMQEAKVDVISVPGLMDLVSTTAGTEALTRRFQAAAAMKGMFNTLVLAAPEATGGTAETFEQKQINFAQFPELIQTFMQLAAGAADIPVTRLVGRSPAGLNATGQSDIRNYYDRVAAEQEVNLRPTMAPLDEVLIRSALGSRPDEIRYEFSPLWQMDETEKTDIELKQAQRTQIYASSGLIPEPVLAEIVKNDLSNNDTYPGIEAAYADFEAGLLEPIVDPNAAQAVQGLASQVKPPITKDYSPDQPRVPAGVPEGGEWTTVGGSGGFVSVKGASVKEFTPAEKAAIGSYAGLDYANINSELRGTESFGGKYDETVKNLDSLLAKSRTSEEQTVYRGVKEDAVKAWHGLLKPGSVITDAGFASTTLDEDVAKSFSEETPKSAMMVIKIPAGTHALNISKLGGVPFEAEVLVHRNSSYRVLRWNPRTRQLELELIR
jgi:phage-related protein (TIGR01555 family)